MEQEVKKNPVTLTDVLRSYFKGMVEPIASLLNSIGLSANTVTVIGLIGNAFGAYFVALGQISLGGVVILFSASLDAVDGTMARLSGRTSSFGAFFDSIIDRYSELLIFGGLMYYYLQHQDRLAVILVYLAVAGSLMVSYTRARAQSLGVEIKIGILSRVERFLVLIPCLIFNQPIIALWLIAILSNVTALQRIWFIRSQSEGRQLTG